MPYQPTPEQNAIIRHDRLLHARILAGPGTGKSATLVALVDHLLRSDSSLRIKLLTFTRAATAELAKKVADRTLATVERPSTIHSFSISVLLQNPDTGDFPRPLRIADRWEDKYIVRPTMAKRAGIRVTKIVNLVQELASNWEFLEPRQSTRVDVADRARFQSIWKEHREVYGYTLLAELPYTLLHALENHPFIDGIEYDLLIVDEYQDLNACDLKVIRLIADCGCKIIGAGDDDQSIYSWRYAAPEGIRSFMQDYQGCADYQLSVTQRCGSSIIDWASYVIEGDSERSRERPRLTSAAGSPHGEVSLLSFHDEVAEAHGVAELIQLLILNGVPAEEILVLLRSDHNGAFSDPIKRRLDDSGIRFSDPEFTERILGEDDNRRMLAGFRLLVNPLDSLAWATLLYLSNGIGQKFSGYIYDCARGERIQFGKALIDAYEANFPNGPRNSAKAGGLIQSIRTWLAANPLPASMPEGGWGTWIASRPAGQIIPAPSEECATLLCALDPLSEPDQEFRQYLGQVTPLTKDRALAEGQGVRIMTMSGAKGLTVRATIVVGLEEGIMPRPDGNSSEERRLLYVAMTRAKEYLFCTWARKRRGPTARVGTPQVSQLRNYTSFLRGGPIESQDGRAFINAKKRPLEHDVV